MSIETEAPQGGAVGSVPHPTLHWRKARFVGLGRRTLTFLLLAGAAAPGLAAEAFDSQTPPGVATDDEVTIVVTGIREYLADVPRERSLDEDSIAAYGLDTIEDLLGEIGAELGDDEQAVILVNGERVESLDDIAGYPTEALLKLEVLPRGSGAAVGGSPRQRVYSLVLRERMRSLALSTGWRVATEGAWSGRRAAAIFTRIQGPNRLNVTLRARDEDVLLESDRGIIQPPVTTPYDLIGNVIPDPRSGATEIDPSLSALAGFPVALAAVPLGSASLAAFAANANRANVTDLGRFRTLRPSTDGYDLNATMSNRLAPWLRSSLSARLGWSDSRSLLGLPSTTFIVPAANAFSPFSNDVGLAAYGTDALRQRFRSLTASTNGALNATAGRWLVSLIGNYSHGERRSRTDRQDFAQLAQPIFVDAPRDPFAGDLGDLLIVFPDRSESRLDNGGLLLRGVGSPLTLPAGRLRLTSSAGFAFSRIASRNFGEADDAVRRYRRNETTLLAGAEIPLASRRNDFLSVIGDLSANLEFGIVDFSDVGTFTRHNLALAWSPQEWLRIFVSTSINRRAADVRLLADPVLESPGSRYFDFLTGETVDVIEISGGNPLLRPERLAVDRLTVNASPMRRINLQLNAEYSRIRTGGFISGVPPASAPIQLAFPDRFVRDADGRLILVDIRPVNFERQRQDQLRYGVSFSVPIGAPEAPGARSTGASEQADSPDPETGDADAPVPPISAGGPRPRIQFSAWHTILFDNEVLIRPGLPPVDLLGGGAIGIGGSPPRHVLNANFTASGRGLGASLTAAYRGESRIQVLSPTSTGVLRFAPVSTFNLRAFIEGRRLFPESGTMRGTRLTLSVNNIANARQAVRDEFGVTPLRFQPGYRDPVGRTVEIEFRKLF